MLVYHRRVTPLPPPPPLAVCRPTVPIYTAERRETKWGRIPCLRKQPRWARLEARTFRSEVRRVNRSATHAFAFPREPTSPVREETRLDFLFKVL